MNQDQVITFKYALIQEIKKKTGHDFPVNVTKEYTKKMKELYVFQIVHPSGMAVIDQFELYEDRSGNIYWDRHDRSFRENTIEKEINQC